MFLEQRKLVEHSVSNAESERSLSLQPGRGLTVSHAQLPKFPRWTSRCSEMLQCP